MPCRKPSVAVVRLPPRMSPTRSSLAGSCACAASIRSIDDGTTPPKSAMNSRRFILISPTLRTTPAGKTYHLRHGDAHRVAVGNDQADANADRIAIPCAGQRVYPPPGVRVGATATKLTACQTMLGGDHVLSKLDLLFRTGRRAGAHDRRRK